MIQELTVPVKGPHLKLTLAVDPAKVDREKRTVPCTITTQAVDHDLEVVITKGLSIKQFLRNPITLWMHDHRQPIGRAVDIKRFDDHIDAVVRFTTTPLAEEVFTWYADGTARGWSVGMDPMTMKRRRINEQDIRKNPSWAGAEVVIEKSDMLEFSAVAVPCNDRALTKMFDSKTAGPIIRRWFEARPELMELVHDQSGVKILPIPITMLPAVLPRT